MKAYRTEKDSMGEIQVPEDALYGAQTQRAVENFTLSPLKMPVAFISALAQIKAAAAQTNAELGVLSKDEAQAIIKACDKIQKGHYRKHFPVDVFQTGSGTSTNMNMNEVLASLVQQDAGLTLHPNDHINLSQSSNDVIPSAIHLSALIQLDKTLLPALEHLRTRCSRKAVEVSEIIKTGRTHLMDAVPMRMEDEVRAWGSQIRQAEQRLESLRADLMKLPQGGTAIGSGLNAPRGFSRRFCTHLSNRTTYRLTPPDSHFAAQACQDTALALSGQLKACATALLKIAEDLRWMNSGPFSGLGEIVLPALQPGSSIMPGKVNPVIPEAVIMAVAQINGNDASITFCAQRGNFQLNTMLPLIAYNLLQSQELLANAAMALADKAIAGFSVNERHIEEALVRNPILVTALNPVIGYELAAEIAKAAYASNRKVIDVAVEMTDISRAELEKLLDPAVLAEHD
ncbi:class II fumarate hydratase [Nitrincola iocasae]|jgi:fumarate hydratase class II|uniref:Fumarate hydratase class II n=1 Tax=Nitrincola iocasae TaxID=2614693 RepID=A0A5J6LGF1_9GAMM|nr:class II fumarate hydratase [Nitrincola iocasae]QEW07657.1 class II fumarate hydratase [Nitrincola iocasae]